MKYLVTLVFGFDPFVEVVSVGVYRWKWWARVQGWVARLLGLGLPGRTLGVRAGFGRLGMAVIWDIPTDWPSRMRKMNDPAHTLQQIRECRKCESRWVWDGWVGPKWEWSKRPCFDCVCEARAQGFGTPTKPSTAVAVVRLVIDPEAGGLVEPKHVQSLMTPELNGDLVPELLEAQFDREAIKKLIGEDGKSFDRHEYRKLLTKGVVPKWRPPCGTCGGNCGQCGSSHCSICGQKSQFPHLKVCDPILHAAYEATKCEKCGDYAFHTCSNGKNAGEEYSARKTYKKGERDAQGDVVNW